MQLHASRARADCVRERCLAEVETIAGMPFNVRHTVARLRRSTLPSCKNLTSRHLLLWCSNSEQRSLSAVLDCDCNVCG